MDALIINFDVFIIPKSLWYNITEVRTGEKVNNILSIAQYCQQHFGSRRFSRNSNTSFRVPINKNYSRLLLSRTLNGNGKRVRLNECPS